MQIFLCSRPRIRIMSSIGCRAAATSECLLHLLLWWIKPEPAVRAFFRLCKLQRTACARRHAHAGSCAAGFDAASCVVPDARAAGAGSADASPWPRAQKWRTRSRTARRRAMRSSAWAARASAMRASSASSFASQPACALAGVAAASSVAAKERVSRCFITLACCFRCPVARGEVRCRASTSAPPGARFAGFSGHECDFGRFSARRPPGADSL